MEQLSAAGKMGALNNRPRLKPHTMSYMPKSHKRAVTAAGAILAAIAAWFLMFIPDDIPTAGHWAVTLGTLVVVWVLLDAGLPIAMKGD